MSWPLGAREGARSRMGGEEDKTISTKCRSDPILDVYSITLKKHNVCITFSDIKKEPRRERESGGEVMHSKCGWARSGAGHMSPTGHGPRAQVRPATGWGGMTTDVKDDKETLARRELGEAGRTGLGN